MNSERPARIFQNKYLIGALLLLTFIVSRLLYSWAGVRFDGETFTKGWQFIDPLLLKTDLWRSLFYLHGQPPLLNLFTGLVLQIFPERYALIFHVFNLLWGVALLFSLYALSIRLGLRPRIAVAFSLWFILSPAAIVYENWYSYAYPLMAALCVSAYFLFRFIETGRFLDGLLFSLPLALTALTWGVFQILWLVVCLGIAVVALWRKQRARSAFSLLFALLLVVAWYGKNAVVFGSFSASSWTGMYLSKMVMAHLPMEVRTAWIKEGLVSDLVKLPPFRSPDTYLKYFPDTPSTGIPILDELTYSTGFPNYHHLVVIKASAQHMRDALRMIRLAPGHYARIVFQSTYIFFHSASDYKHTAGIRLPIDAWDTLWNRIFFWQWNKDETITELGSALQPDHVAWTVVLGYLFVFASAGFHIWKNRATLFTSPSSVVVIFMLWNTLFVSAAGVLLDIGENNRFRYVVEPFLFLLVVFFLLRQFEMFKRPGSDRQAS